MHLFDTTYIRDHVDYSFGDHSGLHTPGGYMRPANFNNQEFWKKVKEVSKHRKVMSVFIDNTRLYRRDMDASLLTQRPAWSYHNDRDRLYDLMKDESLLELLTPKSPKGDFEGMQFIIFTGFDDVSIDEFIYDQISANVLRIYATNAQCWGGKVQPMPYGLQRQVTKDDERLEVLKKLANLTTPKSPKGDLRPNKLLYVNHTNRTEERKRLGNTYKGLHWATVEAPNLGAEEYYKQILRHAFVLCPEGNAVGCDCHRQWEAITLGRVPVMRRTRYLEKIFEGYAVLFVDDYVEVTEELLRRNLHLFDQAQKSKVPDVEEFFRESIKKAVKGISANKTADMQKNNLPHTPSKGGQPPARLPENAKTGTCPLNDFGIDHIYLLNLKRRPDRLAHAMEQIRSIGLQGVQVWPAVDGSLLNDPSIYSHISPGMQGCYRSHVAILQHAMAKGYSRILVLEDDLVFQPGFNEFMNLSLPIIPQDWQFAYLGSAEHGGFGTHRQLVNEFWTVPQSVWGTQAYMVNGREAMEAILKGLDKMVYQVDIQLSWNVLPKLKTYTLFPSMVKQAAYELGTDVQKIRV